MMRLLNKSQVEEQAVELLRTAKALRAPVPVESVARRLGLSLEATPLGEHVSGLLVIENGRGAIGYNSHHARVRQRFTIAHEIGHFVLHGADQALFIDNRYAAVFRRDRASSSGEHRREIQANQFAASLLMPEELVLEEILDTTFDFGDELALSTLAGKFEVSSQAMSLRLASLNIFGG